jgi:hypothetical protein
MAPTVNRPSTRVDYSQLADAAVSNTPNNDAFGTNGKLYFLFVSNKAAGNSANFLKLYDTKEQVTEGTTLPTHIFPIGQNANEAFHFPEGINFANAIAYTASQTGGTAAGAAPGATMTIQMVFK